MLNKYVGIYTNKRAERTQKRKRKPKKSAGEEDAQKMGNTTVWKFANLRRRKMKLS